MSEECGIYRESFHMDLG